MIKKKQIIQSGQSISIERIIAAQGVVRVNKDTVLSACANFVFIWLFKSGANQDLVVRQDMFNPNNIHVSLKEVEALVGDKLDNRKARYEEIIDSNKKLLANFLDATFRFTDRGDYHTDILYILILARYINNTNFFYEAAIKKIFEWRLKIEFGVVTWQDLEEIGINPVSQSLVEGPVSNLFDNLAADQG